MYTKHIAVATLPLAAVALLGGGAAAIATPPTGCFTIAACEYPDIGSATPAGFVTPAEFATPAETAPTRSRGGTSLRFLDVRDQVFELDVGDPGTSPGDALYFNNRLRTPGDTADVGRFASSCTQLPGALYQCHGTLLLAHSTIELATTTDFSPPIIAAVTGGTGAHEGAAGQVSITPTSNPDRSRLQVHLVDPRS
jgi:hypothetical protein